VADDTFDYFFLDEFFDQQYKTDERLSALISMFAGLAIFIASMGLFGLSIYMITDRTKEIGVRKVLGASVYNLWQMLSKDFVLLVIISNVIAVPFSYH